MKPSAQLVVHAAPGHRLQGLRDHLKCLVVARGDVVPEQELQHHRVRELGRATPPPGHPVEALLEALEGAVERLGPELALLSGAGHSALLLESPGYLLPAVQDLIAALSPGVGNGLEQLAEGGQSVARRGREVGAPVEWLASRSEEDGHRPSSLLGHRLHGIHVHLVEIRPFLAIHLYADEMLVEKIGDPLVLERLVRHDVAPMTAAISNA